MARAERGDNGCDHSLGELSGRDLRCECRETLSQSLANEQASPDSDRLRAGAATSGRKEPDPWVAGFRVTESDKCFPLLAHVSHQILPRLSRTLSIPRTFLNASPLK